ncbi:MAG: hypothetical protein H7Z40_20530, partial [Phycisphaerae bacterium]|nr:hypothetical protein [Gemmatimonadaceae bacterium]
MAAVQTTTIEQRPYTDPNGVPAPYAEEFRERKYFTAGVAAAAGLTLVAAIEAMWYAKRSTRGAAVLQPGRVASVTGTLQTYGMTLSPTIDQHANAGLRFSARF